MLARIREKDGKRQTLEEHSRNVSILCERSAAALQLSNAAKLIGIIHDMGKALPEFEIYVEWHYEHPKEDSKYAPKHPNHAPIGAAFAFHRWYKPQVSFWAKVTAQIIALCVGGHHSGLTDCITLEGTSSFLKLVEDPEALRYKEIESYFFDYIASEKELDQLFEGAVSEIEKMCLKAGKTSFVCGLIARFLLSILVDADRWDSACFEYDNDSLKVDEEPNWSDLKKRLDMHLEQLAAKSKSVGAMDKLNKIRAEISKECQEKAEKVDCIVKLSVPTGGGKTFSSLRYALRHAEKYKKQKIFYIIPYNTILDQNAKDIREALQEYPSILEHHSNVVLDSKDELEEYTHLTERWDADIILTSLVQFLNSFFSASNSDTRRLHQLSDAVIIFDEIQAIPTNCTQLFTHAIDFLANGCNSTVVLCTATQPTLPLTSKPEELVENSEVLLNQMKRVRFVIDTKAEKTVEQAAKDVKVLVQNSSVLMITNTKKATWDIYEQTTKFIKQSGNMQIVQFEPGLSAEQIEKKAEQCAEDSIFCVYLTTNICPVQRKEILDWLKVWLKMKKRVLCISTALIEAGVNISFPVVVRSSAGLPSIIQAAGRCNRNMELFPALGTVYIWELADEKLEKLPDIQHGKMILKDIIPCIETENWPLDSSKMLGNYFEKEQNYKKEKEKYPVEIHERTTNLVDLLGNNPVCKKATSSLNIWERIKLHQSFRTAENEFHVIPSMTKAILVPYGEGERLIEQLEQDHSMKEQQLLLRKAQMYSVSVYEGFYRRLVKEEAVYLVKNTGVIALKKEHYNIEGGVQLESGEMDFLNI